MGMVQCIRCRTELESCVCSVRIANPVQPRRSIAVPETLDLAATERLWQAMMREQRKGGD